MGKKKRRLKPDSTGSQFTDSPTVQDRHLSQAGQGRSTGAAQGTQGFHSIETQLTRSQASLQPNFAFGRWSVPSQRGLLLHGREAGVYHTQGVPVEGSSWGYTNNMMPLQAGHFRGRPPMTGMHNVLQEAGGLLRGMGSPPGSIYLERRQGVDDRHSIRSFNSPLPPAARPLSSYEQSSLGRDHRSAELASTECSSAEMEQHNKPNFDDNYREGLRSDEVPATGRKWPDSLQSNQSDVGTASVVSKNQGTEHISAGMLVELLPPATLASSTETDSIRARVEKVATVAYEEVLAAGKGVTVWKVMQAVLLLLKASSLESLSIRLHDVPCLRKLLLLEGKVNTYIECHVAVRRITTLHDLSSDVCQHEGVKDFDQLGLGPLTCHPLVVQYFAPPAQSDVYKITTEQVIQYLSNYMNKHPGKVQVEEFLSFMTKERSVTSPKHLCVRIQSFGMYVSFIRREKKAEKEFASRQASSVRATELATIKPAQEPSITERVDSFLASTKKEAAVGHASHVYIDSDDEECSNAKDIKSKEFVGNKKEAFGSRQLLSTSCPYPSAAEERERMFTNIPPHLNSQLSASEVTMSNQELGDFVAAWKDICHKHSVLEVLTRLLHAYHPGEKKKKGIKSKKKQAALFKIYPAIGLLNVAVMSMKAGHWDSLYDAFQEAEVENWQHHKEAKTAEASDMIEVDATTTSQSISKVHDFTAPSASQVSEELIHIFGDICMENDDSLDTGKQVIPDEEKFCAILKRVLKCEKMLAQRFSVKEFSCLEVGEFPEFIEQHWDRLSKQMMGIFMRRIRTRHWENIVPEHRIRSFISQVQLAVGDEKEFSEKEFLQLLCRQFHLQHVDELGINLMDRYVKPLKHETVSNCPIYFSSALLATKTWGVHASEKVGLLKGENKQIAEIQGGYTVGVLGSVTSSDALCCLQKAPMLCNLADWSQWDSVFSPTLGPFLDWLEGEGTSGDLVCLVTCDGAMIRIDGSATVDDFLVAAANGCGKQAAVQLVSVVAVYGGVERAPQALLKSHASQAIEILVSNSHRSLNNFRFTDGRLKRKDFVISEDNQVTKRAKHHILDDAGAQSSLSSGRLLDDREKKYFDKYDEAIKFVVDCLSYVPSEFGVFAASVFIPALSGIVPDATAAILNYCITTQHRMKLHEIGMALGIPEWVSDFRSSFLASPLRQSEEISKLKVQEEKTMACKDGSEHSLSAACTLNDAKVEDVEAFGRSQEESDKVNKKLLAEGEAGHATTKLVELYVDENASTECRSVKQNECAATLDVSMNSLEQEKEARDVIERIRKEEFGMDLELQSEELSLLAKQHARIGRALQCLSRELYSQDSHFVLELVQNADDNQYGPGVEAMLIFILQNKRIVVVNNELGFTAANMKALSDVGNSTKAGSAAGYIGHKGIGFKSVFRVTDAPEIHSKGFHVKFDTSEGNLGFILPTVIPPATDCHSIDEVLSTTEEITGHGKLSWNTCMILPLKSSVVEGPELDLLSAKLSDIHPSLLLFLHRLRSITIKNDLTGSMRVMRRQDLDDGLVRVVDRESSATWLVVKETFEAAVERSGVGTTEISLAFPLRELSARSYEACHEHQQVFAFLPLRSYGLRFIVQGDFILPSSREEIDTDSAWNQWLLSEIPKVCVKAVDAVKELSCFQQSLGKAASVLMSFMPLEGEVQGFFSSLPRMILASLRSSRCLPVEGREGEWALPCMLLGGWDDFSRRLLPDALLREHLGLRYLHRDVVVNPLLASGLGVHMYGAGVLVNLMESLCDKKGALEALGPRWISCWLVALRKCLTSQSQQASYFSQQRTEADVVRKLRHLPFIPLSNGTFTSVEEGSVWLPCGDSETVNEATILLENFPVLYSELRTVHPLLLHPLSLESDDSDLNSGENGHPTSETEFRSLLCLMLQRVGVGQMLAHEVVSTHILPSMASQEFLEKQKPLALQCLTFVMLHLESKCKQCQTDRSKIFMQLQEMAVIVTSTGYKMAGNEPVHFGVEFGCPVDVKRILHGTQVVWTEIDPAYLKVFQDLPEETTLSRWRMFLKEIGVTDFVKVKQVEKKLCDKSASIWKDVSWEGYDGADDWNVRDWECPELMNIIRDLCDSDLVMPQKLEQCSHLLKALDLLWEEYYSGCTATYWCARAAVRVEKKTEASVVLQMRSLRWVQSSFDGELHHPTELFHRCFSVESILGNNAPYAATQIESKGLSVALGLRMDVSANDVLDLLRVWSQHPLKASVGQMTRLYTLLWSEMAMHKEYVLLCFVTQPSIFLPMKANVKADKTVAGRFFSLNEVCWNDETGCLALLMKSKVSSDSALAKSLPFREISSIYPTMHSFFVDECHVRETLNFKEYLSVLKILAGIYSPHEVLKQVIEVFAKWSQDIEMNRVSNTDLCEWMELLQDVDNQVLPTLQDKWVSLHKSVGLVCWCDDEVLGKQFLESKGIFYVHNRSTTAQKHGELGIRNSKDGDISSFLQAMKIPGLSEVVEREPIVYGAQSSGQLLDLLKWTLPFVQRYLWQSHSDHYKLLKRSSFGDRVKGLRCVIVDQLFFRYMLPGGLGSGSQRTECDYLLQGDTIYATHLGNLNSLFLEFSRLFFNGKSNLQLANFLHLITLSAQSGSQESEVEALIISSQGIAPLPNGETPWTIQSSNLDMLLESASQRHSERHFNVIDPAAKRRMRGVTDNVWPPRTWQQKPDKTSFEPSPLSRFEACEKSLAFIMKEIDTKKNLKTQKGVCVDNKEIHASETGCNNEIVSSRIILLSDAAKDQALEQVMVPSATLEMTSQDLHDSLKILASERNTTDKATNLSTDAQLNNIISQVEGDIIHQGEDSEVVDHGSFTEREHLVVGQPNEQQQTLTGRLGEALVFKYLLEKHGPAHVKWLNADVESGSSYDIVIEEGNGQKKFIEVKATWSGDKDWFEITQREWELALQAGERFIIIRVFFVGSLGTARLVWLPNPIKLCQDRIIKLAVILPQNHSTCLLETTNLMLRSSEDNLTWSGF